MTSQDRIRIGALVSGGGTNLQAVLDACDSGDIPGDVVFVGTDNPDAKGLGRAHKKNIPTFTVPYSEIIKAEREFPGSQPLPEGVDLDELRSRQALFGPDTPDARVMGFLRSRVIAEAQLLAHMESCGFDLLILAGFMRTLTPYFIDRVNTNPALPRIMNIHPALLPSFPGIDGYGDTFRYGCKIGGCTVHFIDYGEDTGPIIGQNSFDIDPGDDLDAVKQKGLKEEWALYPECVRLFAEGRVSVVTDTFELPKGRVVSRRRVHISPK